ncbi:hypothetical protein Tco_0587830 [Tanacetum coccineum]
MAKKDMHTYVSCLKETELKTLIATYDIPLDLRPRLPDPNFRMINLPVGDTAIGGDCRYPPPDRNVITKADHAAKQKASTGPEISTNVTKRTRSSKKGSDQFAMEGNESLHDVSPVMAMLILIDARFKILLRCLERELLPFVPWTYYMPYPFDGGLRGAQSPTLHQRQLGRKQESIFWTHRLRELSSVELSDRMSMLQCQLITHGSMLNARYDHSLRNVERLSKQCAQQTQTIKKQRADLKKQSESTVRANEEVSRLKSELGALNSKCKATEQKLSSWDKKHRKYRNEKDALVMEKEKIETELVGTKSQLDHYERQAGEIQDSIASFFQSDFSPLVRKFLKSGEFNQAFAGVLNTTISVGVERGLRMDRIDEEFRGLSQKVVDIAQLEPDRVTSSHQTSSVAASLRDNTHIRHSTSLSGTFGHTSTPEHLKKKKKSVEKGGPLAA